MIKPTVTASTTLPVTLAQVKSQVTSEDFIDDDVLLDSYIRAAVAYLDGPAGVLGRALIDQTVVQPLSGLSESVCLTYGEATSLTSVEYYDADNVLQTLAGAELIVETSGAYVWIDPALGSLPVTYDRPNAVRVTYQAGWPDAEAVPASIKAAISMLAATWYEHREDFSASASVTRVPFGVNELIAPYRRVGV